VPLLRTCVVYASPISLQPGLEVCRESMEVLGEEGGDITTPGVALSALEELAIESGDEHDDIEMVVVSGSFRVRGA
jgi:hypothetical protein